MDDNKSNRPPLYPKAESGSKTVPPGPVESRLPFHLSPNCQKNLHCNCYLLPVGNFNDCYCECHEKDHVWGKVSCFQHQPTFHSGPAVAKRANIQKSQLALWRNMARMHGIYRHPGRKTWQPNFRRHPNPNTSGREKRMDNKRPSTIEQAERENVERNKFYFRSIGRCISCGQLAGPRLKNRADRRRYAKSAECGECQQG